jgi:propionyl-CoA synthetase
LSIGLPRSLARSPTRPLAHNDNRNRQSKVTHFAGVLANTHGVEKGDRVLIYMPMIPQGNPCSDALMRIIEALQALTPLPRCAAIIAMLACARIGAIHSVVFGGFAADQLAVRIDHAKPKVMKTREREWPACGSILGRGGAGDSLGLVRY